MKLNRQHVISLGALLAVSLLAGCGQAAPGAAQLTLKEKSSVSSAKAVKTEKAAAVTRTESVIDIVAPAEHQGTGSIAMNFKFPEEAARKVLATANDISKITVTLKTKSFLLTKTVATVDVVKANIVGNRAAVNFPGLEGKTYTVDLVAYDASNADIGSTSSSVDVVAGKTSTVDAKLQLKASTPTTPATTALGVNIEVLNGL
jgi:hypothetical protein